MFVRIAFLRTLAEAQRIQSLLESEGLHPVPIDSSAHVTVAGAEQGYHLEVPRREVEAAREILEREGLGKWILR